MWSAPPRCNRRWWAGRGLGAYAAVGDGPPRTLSVSAVGDLASASLSFSSLSGWADLGLRDEFVALTDAVWRVRGYGDFFSYCLVAEGAVDIAAEPEVKLWDLAPLDILVREAGGAFTNLAGAEGPHGGNAVATNGLLHDAVLASLSALASAELDGQGHRSTEPGQRLPRGWPAAAQTGHAPGHRHQRFGEFEPGEVGAHAQMQPAAERLHGPSARPRDVEPVGFGVDGADPGWRRRC